MTPSSAKKRKKLPDKVLPKLSDSDSNVPKKKPEEVPTKNYFIGSGEKVVPIRDVFKNRILDIEAFKQDKPEIYKALIYIMESDMKVMKAQVTDLLKTLRNLKILNLQTLQKVMKVSHFQMMFLMKEIILMQFVDMRLLQKDAMMTRICVKLTLRGMMNLKRT